MGICADEQYKSNQECTFAKLFFMRYLYLYDKSSVVIHGIFMSFMPIVNMMNIPLYNMAIICRKVISDAIFSLGFHM
jgi:hypothetical protein